MSQSKATTALLRLKEIDKKYRTKYESVQSNKISDISSESSLDSSGSGFKKDSRPTVPTFFPGKPKIESIGKQKKDAFSSENNSTTQSSSLFVQKDQVHPKVSGISTSQIFKNENLLNKSSEEGNPLHESIKRDSDSVSIKEDNFEIPRNGQSDFLIQETSIQETEDIEEVDEISISEETNLQSGNSAEVDSSRNESKKDPSENYENQEFLNLSPQKEDEKYNEDSFEEISSSEEESEVEEEGNRKTLKTIASTREDLGEFSKVDAEKLKEIDENVGDALDKTSSSRSDNFLENNSFGMKEANLRNVEKETKEILPESQDEGKSEKFEEIISQLSDKALINKSGEAVNSSKVDSVELKNITPKKLVKHMELVSPKLSDKNFVNKDQPRSPMRFSDTRLAKKEEKDFLNSFPKCSSSRRSKSGKESRDSTLICKAEEMTLVGTLENINRSTEAAKSGEDSTLDGNKAKVGKSQFGKELVAEKGRNLEKEGKNKDDTEIKSLGMRIDSSLNEINTESANTGRNSEKSEIKRYGNKMEEKIKKSPRKSWKEKSVKKERPGEVKKKGRVKKTEIEFPPPCECSKKGRRSCKNRGNKYESSIKVNSHLRDQGRPLQCRKRRDRILAMIEYRLKELGRHQASISTHLDSQFHCYIKALEFPKIMELSSGLVDYESEDHPIILKHRLIQIQQWLKNQMMLYQKYSSIALDLNNSYIPITLESTKKMIKEIRIAADLCKATRKVRVEK